MQRGMSISSSRERVEEIINGLKEGRRAELARAISMIEDGSPESEEILTWAFSNLGKARVTGITGAPGVGKSTLVDGLISQLRDGHGTVGVIAVDPSSPFTGGAILGDRVRMRSHTLDPDVFFRSLATRGHLGGLSRHTGDAIAVMDAFGFDNIIVETVGAGQSEVDIMKYAHTVVVVLAPGLGDEIQAIKAGILEIGDVFCINKADTPDADRTVRELEMMLNLKEWHGWRPPCVKTVGTSGEGLADLKEAILSHQKYLLDSKIMVRKTRERFRAILEEYMKARTYGRIMELMEEDGSLDRYLDQLASGQTDPSQVAEQAVRTYLVK